MSDRYDVIVIGLGPVGALATILLAAEGLSVAVIERDPEVYRLPRAVGLDGEIVRALQPLGLADAVNALLQPVREGERAGFANSRREWLFGNESVPFGSNGWQPMSMFDQPELEGFLRETALGYPNVTAFVGGEASELNDHGSHVSVLVEQAGETIQLSGQYLVGCDGAASSTRRAIGTTWQNLGYDHDWLVVDVVTLPGHTLGVDTLQVCDPARISTYVATKDPYRRWEFKLNPGETWEEMLEPERIAALIETWTPPGTYEIRRAAMYQFHAATANTWRLGRMFIAGDAAHQTPPFLGQGMNAGMRDVINLTWKLKLVLSGAAQPSLLDAYQAERKAHAHDLVQWAVSIGQLMEHLAAVEAAQNESREPPEMDPKLLASGYGQGRGMPPLRAGVVMADQVRDDGAAGYLFAQPIVRNAGSEQRLDDVLGDGFAVVGLSAEALTMSADSEALLRRLDARVVSLDGIDPVRGRFDRGFSEAEAIVVRPDRHIFGLTEAGTTLDQLVAELGRKLELHA